MPTENVLEKFSGIGSSILEKIPGLQLISAALRMPLNFASMHCRRPIIVPANSL